LGFLIPGNFGRKEFPWEFLIKAPKNAQEIIWWEWRVNNKKKELIKGMEFFRKKGKWKLPRKVGK